jgi:hypothetical protein
MQLGWHPVAAVQHTFSHKQYTEFRERNKHNNKKNWEVRAVPRICEYMQQYWLCWLACVQLTGKWLQVLTALRVAAMLWRVGGVVVQISSTYGTHYNTNGRRRCSARRTKLIWERFRSPPRTAYPSISFRRKTTIRPQFCAEQNSVHPDNTQTLTRVTMTISPCVYLFEALQ